MENAIKILDFGLFFESMKAIAKLVDAAKLQLSPNGLTIYGVRGNLARCEMTTNSIYSDEEFSFCIDELSTFNRVLSTVKDIHKDDFSELEISYSRPKILFKSKKLKMKYSTCNESIVANWTSTKMTFKMSPAFSFKTSSDLIKRMNGHSFLFKDTKSMRLYIETKDDMENNAVFATLGSKDVDLGKEITLKFGLVTDGKIPEGKKIIIDLERMNLFNCMQSNEIEISLMDCGCLLSKTHVVGKNSSYFNIDIYSTIMKA